MWQNFWLAKVNWNYVTSLILANAHIYDTDLRWRVREWLFHLSQCTQILYWSQTEFKSVTLWSKKVHVITIRILGIGFWSNNLILARVHRYYTDPKKRLKSVKFWSKLSLALGKEATLWSELVHTDAALIQVKLLRTVTVWSKPMYTKVNVHRYLTDPKHRVRKQDFDSNLGTQILHWS